MSPYLKITGMTISMWIIGAFVNGIICGTTMSVIRSDCFSVIPLTVIIFFLTAIFSIPAFFIYWITLLFLVAGRLRERALFRVALISASILSIPVACLGSGIYEIEFGDYSAVAFSSIVLSAFLTVFFHLKQFKKII